MRRLAFAAVCGSLVLAACSDQTQSPTEPTVQPPAQHFGSTCTHGRYPIRNVIPLIAPVFSNKKLRTEALLRVAAIALLWDFCQDGLARRAAFRTLAWIDRNAPPSAARELLKAAILNAFGAGEFPDDFVADFYEPGTEKIFTTPSGRATLKLGECAFDERTLITIRRLPDDFRLTGHPADRQDSPFWDYDATNSSTDNTVETHMVGVCPGETEPDATMAFCFKSDGGGGHVNYPPPGARIGHNPVGGGPPVFEFVDEVAVPPELEEVLTACPPEYGYGPFFRMGSAGGGLSGLTHLTWSSAGHYLARLARTLFLPAPLRAATVGERGPIAGKPINLSPFGVVLADCPVGGPYTYFCLDGE